MLRVSSWTVKDVENWLVDKDFEAYVDLFCVQHKIDGKALLVMTEGDLKSPPLSLKEIKEHHTLNTRVVNKVMATCAQKKWSVVIVVLRVVVWEKHCVKTVITCAMILGDIKHLLIAINDLQMQNPDPLAKRRYSSEDILPVHRAHAAARLRKCRAHVHSSESSDLNTFGSDGSGEEMDQSECSSKHVKPPQMIGTELKPELWKTIIGMIYFFSVTWLTAIVMVIVHDRVPDMQTYPPLPDIFLDNIPLIPWAFTMCEFTGIVLFFIWILILFFHKHRFILLRRMCSLFGSVFLLRCITMIITSLSVPGKHLECTARSYKEWWEKLYAALLIWIGGGMSVQGVRTCGDYMFSGHTVSLTLLNFFITEYTPRTWYYLHTFTWVLNLFGIFFILAGHEHYSIDVFIAFYISTRLFLYYHTLANNRALMQDDRRRTRIWFPLFYFFESGVDGIVPNEYQWPVFLPKKFMKYLHSFL